MGWSRSWLLAAVLAAVLVVPWQQQRLVASQGLNVAPATLGAGAQATATEFEVFEDVLSLALTTTGGRGRGGRGGASNLGGGPFKSGTEFEQLQTAIYYVGGSPKRFNALSKTDSTPQRLSLKPPVRDQGLICHTCVGQALASAIQLSLAFNLEHWTKTGRPPKDIWKTFVRVLNTSDDTQSRVYDVDAQALYYCSAGGRSCETGWDIPEALSAALDDHDDDELFGNQAGKWMRPEFCLDQGIDSRDFIKKEAENVLWTKVCQDAAIERPEGDDALSPQNVSNYCFNITTHPLYTCTYTSLSNFWQIQRWIRLHGSVITRVQVPDDFEIFLNDTASQKTGQEWRVYDKNVSAKPDFGHAALIVGYDNEEYTWTILNSWGTGRNNDRPRGYTKDGTFRVRMGLLGIGTPDATYGVRCYPRQGSLLDPNNLMGWKADARNALGIKTTNETSARGCPIVQTVFTKDRFDGLTGFVDFKGMVDFNPRIIEFVQSNYPVLEYKVTEFSYKFPYRLNNRTMAKMWEVVRKQTTYVTKREASRGNHLTHTHYFECFYYNDTGDVSGPFHCPPWYKDAGVLNATNQPTRDATFADMDMCTRNGTVECTLRYWDLNVTDDVPEGILLRQPLCGANVQDIATDCLNATYCYYQGPPPPPEAESTAMKRILDEIDGQWTQGTEIPQGSRVNYLEWIVCPDTSKSTINKRMTTPSGRNIIWVVNCTVMPKVDGVPRVTSLYFRVDADFTQQPILTAQMQDAIGSLLKLQSLDIRVYDGELTPALNTLNDLKSLAIYHICMSSSLPYYWLTSYAWSKLEALRITKDPTAYFYAPGGTDPNTECGIVDAIPASWDNKFYPDLTIVDLSYNRLSGSLPKFLINQWKSLKTLLLQQNQLTGPIPSEWAIDVKQTGNLSFDFSNNNFQFDFPLTWSAFNGTLASIKLDNNAELTGCVPIIDVTANISAVGTSMFSNEGRCSNAPNLQKNALNKHLQKVLGATARRAAVGARQSDATNITAMLEDLLTQVQGLGNLVPRGEDSTSLQAFSGVASAKLEVTRAPDGVEFITAVTAANAALGLADMTIMVRDLPALRSFTCESCNRSGPGSQRNISLLATLPAAAANLAQLALPSSKVIGTLPPEWRSWSSLKTLDLAKNSLVGKLPAQYGNSNMSRALVMRLQENRGLSGNVPSSYSWFSGTGIVQLDVTGSKVSGCCPDGLKMLPQLPFCYQQQNGTSTSVLKALKAVLQSNSGQSAALDEWDVNNTITSGEQDPRYGPYRYCNWTGITCRSVEDPQPADGTIIELDLAALGISYPAAGPALSDIANSILPLSALQTLIVSDMKLAGTIPTTLAGFQWLESLDLRLNPGLVGTLPEVLGGLTFLKAFDISYCSGLTGSLPSLYAAMAALESFNAANCSGLEGSVPPSWVLLKNLQSLKISSSKANGTLPDWTNATTLRKATYATKRAAEKTVKRSAGPAALSKAAKRAAAALSAAAAGDVVGWSKLKVLVLSDNALEGTVPASYSTLLSLSVLDLSGNGMLSGPLPSLGKLELLQELDLAGNAFTGTLPPSYNQLTQLRTLNLASNNITGQLPGEWVSLNALQLMDVSANNITGAVPTIWQAFGGLAYQLQCLVLHSNPGLNKAFPGAPDSIVRKDFKVVTSPSATCLVS